jgi:hypothetical protein
MGLALQEGEDMANHLDTFREFATQIENLSDAANGSQIHVAELVTMLSPSLPGSYEPLIVAL